MFDNYDLFSMIGFEPVEQEELKGKTKKKNEISVIGLDKAKKTDGKDDKKKKSTKLTFKVPVTVYTGFREPMQFGADFFKKEYVDQDELFEAVIKLAPEYDKSYSEIQQDSKNKDIAYLGFKSSSIIHKGAVKLTSNSDMILAGASFDLTELMSNDECDVELKDISELFSNEIPAISNIAIVQKNDTIVPIFDMEMLSSEDILFPVRVYIFGRDKFEVSENEYKEFLISLGNEIDTEEEIKFDKKIFEELIINKYPDFGDGHLEIQYNKATNILVPCLKLEKPKTNTSGKVQKLYPTDAIISLIWTQHKLEPALFGGKEEVSEKEILEYLSTLHCEYQPSTTTIIYDEKLKLIKPMYKGSSKGANIETIAFDIKEAEKRCDVEVSGYQLFEYISNYPVERLYRIESTPVSLTIAPINHNVGGRFEFRLPKVPLSIFELINKFFGKVSTLYDSEVMLRLFYKHDTQDYHLELPFQKVTAGTIEAEFDPAIQMNSDYIHIADFHSHNKYPAFFSGVDNRDEKANLVYGVFGPYNTNVDTNFCLRASTGGYYKYIKKEDLFNDFLSVSEEDIETLSNMLLTYAADRMQVRN